MATATIPDTDTELKLHRHADRFAISIPGRGELMNSRVHGSEIALAELTCKRLTEKGSPCLLIGGLGMGFTLAATLKAVGDAAEVVVAELVPEVVDWNRDLLGDAAGHPLQDPRSKVFVGDVARLLRESAGRFDAVMMDVDNGPEALIRRENDWLYSPAGLAAARRAMKPDGVLAVWSASPDRRFTERLEKAGFDVDLQMVRPHRAGRGARHY
ncbi:MAG: spermidine synthase, partial [Wenzhouxiangellaceae bacterium]